MADHVSVRVALGVGATLADSVPEPVREGVSVTLSDAVTELDSEVDACRLGLSEAEAVNDDDTDDVDELDATIDGDRVGDGVAVAMHAVRTIPPSAPADATAPPPTKFTVPIDAKGQVPLRYELPPPPAPPK